VHGRHIGTKGNFYDLWVLKLLLFCCASLLVLTHALKGINEESEEDISFRKHYV
jgi:hypothetical protein